MPTKTELKKREAIALFLAGKTETEVAEAIGVSRQTIWKWKKHEDLNFDVVEAGQCILSEHTLAVSNLFDEAIAVMSELLKSEDESIKFKVATTVLNSAGNWRAERPAPPGTEIANQEIHEEQQYAIGLLDKWGKKFTEQGGKPDDFMMWVLQGKHEENGNGADAAESTESKETEKPESAKTPD